jgi:hypothetical protein
MGHQGLMSVGADNGPTALTARTRPAALCQARGETAARRGWTWALQGSGQQEGLAQLPR